MLSELLGDDVKSAGYLERLQLLGTQLTRWASKAPKNKPTFREMLADGSFVPLPEILAKTLPFIVAAAQAFDGTSPSSAVAVRDAVVLAAVAGDGNPNERPGELTWVQDGAIGGGCVDPKVSSACPQHFPPQTLIPTPLQCTAPGSCRGSTATLLGDASIAICLRHHKTENTAGPREWTVQVWKLCRLESLEAL